VFVDGRADVYGADLLRNFRAVMELRPAWQQILDEWQIQAVLVPASSATTQALALDPTWRLNYQDSQASLFVRAPRTGGTPEIRTVSQAGLPFIPQNPGPDAKNVSRPDLNLRN